MTRPSSRIAHRLKTVRRRSNPLVLDNAHIVSDTHAELIPTRARHADFVSARQEEPSAGSWLSERKTYEPFMHLEKII